jgi:anti-sigma factor RsiW
VANKPTRETAFQIYNKGPINSFFWLASDCTYAVTGTIDQQSLLAVARAIYHQLTGREHS